MSPVEDTAFVLRTWPLRESDLVVSAFAREHGKVRGVAHGAKKPSGKWAGALEPLTEVRLHWKSREGQELLTLSDAEILRSPYHPMPPLAVTWTLAFLAELVDETSLADDSDDVLYRLVGTCVDALLASAPPVLVARYAVAWALQLHGVLPELDGCVACSRQLEQEGGTWQWSRHGIACPRCAAGGDPTGPTLLPDDIELLGAFRRLKPAAVPVPSSASLRRTGVFLSRLLAEMLGRTLDSERFLDEAERLG